MLVSRFFMRTNLESWEDRLEVVVHFCFYELCYVKHNTVVVKKKLHKQQFTF